MVGTRPRNSTVFLMIKTELTPYGARAAARQVQLLVSVELQVTDRPGFFAVTDVLDFGLLRFGDRSRRMEFAAYSTVEKGLEVESIYVNKNNYPTYGVYMQFASKPPISVRDRTPVPIALVELDTNFLSLNTSEKLHRVEGEIVAESRGGNYNVTMAFKALVFLG